MEVQVARGKTPGKARLVDFEERAGGFEGVGCHAKAALLWPIPMEAWSSARSI
jgi:hypothetical protein